MSGSVDADEFAVAISEPHVGQQEKEFFEVETLGGALHRQNGIAIEDALRRLSRRQVPSIPMMQTS